MSPGLEGCLAVLLLGIALRTLQRLPRSTAHGSAGWTTPRCEPDLVFPVGTPLPAGSLLLAETGRQRVALPLRQAQQHTVILGGSGTGKSRGYFLPNAALMIGSSLVCTDPKSELWRHTSGFHGEAWRFAPTEPEASTSFNWVPLCQDAAAAELCARAIVESGNTAHTEQAWLDMESAFLAALFAHAAVLSEPTPLTAYRLFTRQSQEELLEQLLASPSEAAREQAMVFLQTQERMRGSIVPVVAAKLQFLRDPRVQRFTSAELTPPELGALRHRPLALYWCLGEHDIVRLRPLTSLFFTLLLEQLAAAVEEAESSVPVTLLLDEFANVGVIPHFETIITLARGRVRRAPRLLAPRPIITLARGRGVGLVLGIQSLSQLEARYGRANAQTILANCSTKIALAGLDVESAEYISRTLGQGTHVSRRRAWHRRGFVPAPSGSTQSLTEHGRPLLTADEVRRIPADHAIVVTGNRRPLLLPKSTYGMLPRTATARSLGPAQSVSTSQSRQGLAIGEQEPPPLPADLSLSSAQESDWF